MVWMLDVWHTSRHTQPDWLTSLKKKRNVSTIKVSLNGKQKYENEHQLTICRKRRPSKCHTKFSPSRSMHWNCVFRHPKESSAAAPFCHLKGSIGRCLQPILQMPTPSLKAWSPPSTEINASLNICSKYFRKHLQHKCQHQISIRTKYLSNISKY